MKRISNKEFAWYLASGLIVAIGIVAMVFGIVGHHIDGTLANNPIVQFEDKIVLDLRTWGILLMFAGVLLAIIVLLYNAKRADRDIEKKIRREQRLAAQSSNDIKVKDAVEVITEEKK